MKNYYQKTFFALTFVLSVLVLFQNWQVLAAEYTKELGRVLSRGERGNFEILVNGQPFAKDNNFYVSILDGFPSPENPQ